MNKKKKYLVIDVETANSMDDPLVYDIGLAVCDNSGKIYCTRSYIVKEIFFGEAQMMKSAYYAAKIPQYKEGILRGEYYVAPFLHIWDSIRRIMKLYNIKTVMAYNCNFDRKALNTTLRFITKSRYRYFFPFETEFNCIWNMSCQVLYSQKKFCKAALSNGWISEKGNLQTSAEIGKRYISSSIDFTEKHTGLEDVLIEVELFAACVKKHKAMNRNISRLCWRLPTQAHKKEIAAYKAARKDGN